MPDTLYHVMSPEAALQAQQSQREGGLSAAEASSRLATSGPNALATRPGPGWVRRIVAQLSDVTVLALVAAGVLAVAISWFEGGEGSWLERYGDAVAIAAIVVLNAVIGLVQEQRAESALQALQSMTAPSARVRRGGQTTQIEASALVPGDVVLLSEGDRVPADLRLLEVAALQITEAALTGEARAVRKDAGAALVAETPLGERATMAFASTHVASGRGEGLVVATGMETEIGRIAGMLSAVELPDTPLKQSLRRFGNGIVIACVVVSAVVFGAGMLREDADLPTLLLTAVSLAVAAIPEGLPAITTIVLALGVQRMAGRHAVVRNLPAVETLGCAQVICTDKTGTLTQNRMVVRRIFCAGERWEIRGDFLAAHPQAPPTLRREGEASEPTQKLRSLLSCARFAPEAQLEVPEAADAELIIHGDATDGALLLLHRGLQEGEAVGEVTLQLPFDRERMLSTTVERAEGARVAWVHGAAERVLACCTRQLAAASEGEEALEDAHRAALEEVMHDWADLGLRVLALAKRRLEGEEEAPEAIEAELTFLGLLAIADPPRMEVAAALQQAAGAGVRTLMITGDHPRTAAAIARELGLGAGETPRILAGPEIEAMSEAALREAAPQLDVVARASAEHKLRVLQALTSQGIVAAMTGDGVNDAPAIRAATIGIAMGRGGTDVAREAADLVLQDDNYATIVAAIEEGRIIYDNIKKFIIFLLCINTGLVLAVFAASLLGWPALLTPTQILWINLITNGLPALALGMEPIHPDPMTRPPRRSDEPLLLRRELVWMGAWGVVMAGAALGAFAWMGGASASGSSLREAQTFTFTVLAFMPMFHAFNTRNLTASLFTLGLFSNRPLWIALGVAGGLQALALYAPGISTVFQAAPMSLGQLGLALGLSALILPLAELQKAAQRWLRPTRA